MPVEYRTISIVRCDRLSRRVDQAGHLLHTQDLRQPAGRLRVRRVVEQIATLQRLHEEEAQRRHVEPDGLRLQLPLAQEIRLVATAGACDSAGRADT